MVSGDGDFVELSLRGCCVESHPGSTLRTRVHVLPDGPPITISEAVLRWAREGRFGSESLSLAPEEWARLQDTVTQIEMEPYERVSPAAPSGYSS